MQYHPELTRVLAEERRRGLFDDARARRLARNQKAARKGARRFLSLRSRAAPSPARSPGANAGAGAGRLSPRAKSA